MSIEDNPFVDLEEVDGDSEEELIFCWKNSNRACSPDCVAFDERALDDDRFSSCIMINVKRADSKALATIGAQLKRQNEAYEQFAVKASGKKASEEYAQKLKELDRDPPEVG